MSAIASRFFRPCQVLLLAVALAACSFVLQARQGINLSDEGFLWYGVQQTAHGKVPLRDFQSYDPGRYYWSAAVTFLFGKGLFALRLSETAFQVIGLWAGLMAATRLARSWTLLVAMGLMLTIWMFPSHKFFDHTFLLCGIWVAIRMIEEPSPRRVFAGGLFAGLCVFFGRNHALYNCLAQGFLLLLLYCKSRQLLPFSRLGIWLAGLVIGSIPIVGMLLCVPGFASSYVESIRAMLFHPTNLPLPVPWPWHISFSVNSIASAQQFLPGIFLVLLPLGYVAAISACLFMRAQTIKDHALFVACGFVGLFYMHHAFSRADLSHLVQAIHPFTLGAVAVPGFFSGRKRFTLPLIAVFSGIGLLAVSTQPAYERWHSKEPWAAYDARDGIFVPQNTSRLIDCVRQFAAKNIAKNEGLLIAPFLPGLYPIVDRPAPLWDLAFYFPATAERQNQMIRELNSQNVNWAIVSDIIPGSREDLRLSATHKLVWQYLTQNFDPAENKCLQNSAKILHRKNSVLSTD